MRVSQSFNQGKMDRLTWWFVVCAADINCIDHDKTLFPPCLYLLLDNQFMYIVLTLLSTDVICAGSTCKLPITHNIKQYWP